MAESDGQVNVDSLLKDRLFVLQEFKESLGVQEQMTSFTKQLFTCPMFTNVNSLLIQFSISSRCEIGT